jgi:butyryl-CoA dehydrogenase
MQVLGGYEYSTKFPVERMYRDAKAWGMADGTIQMLKKEIIGMIFGRRFDQRIRIEINFSREDEHEQVL